MCNCGRRNVRVTCASLDGPCVRACVCTQGRAGRPLLIRRAIAAKVCLVINIGLSISGEELPLSVFTAEINMSRVARLPLVVSTLHFQPRQVVFLFFFLRLRVSTAAADLQEQLKSNLLRNIPVTRVSF